MDTTKRTTIIEWDEDSGIWFLMYDSGDVSTFMTATAALAAIKRSALRLARSGMVVDKIEWRNVPQGFVVPS